MVAKVSATGDIEIPKALRHIIDLTPGTRLLIDVKGNSLILRPASPDLPDWRSMEGMIQCGPGATGIMAEARREELERDEARLQGH